MRLDNKLYSDLDLSFIPSPLTGDLTPKYDIEAIKRSIRHMFQFNRFDSPFNSSLKCNVKEYLFEPDNQLIKAKLEDEIKWIVSKMEPRVKLTDVNLEFNTNSKTLTVTITYQIQSLNVNESFNFTVERVR